MSATSDVSGKDGHVALTNVESIGIATTDVPFTETAHGSRVPSTSRKLSHFTAHELNTTIPLSSITQQTLDVQPTVHDTASRSSLPTKVPYNQSMMSLSYNDSSFPSIDLNVTDQPTYGYHVETELQVSTSTPSVVHTARVGSVFTFTAADGDMAKSDALTPSNGISISDEIEVTTGTLELSTVSALNKTGAMKHVEESTGLPKQSPVPPQNESAFLTTGFGSTLYKTVPSETLSPYHGLATNTMETARPTKKGIYNETTVNGKRRSKLADVVTTSKPVNLTPSTLVVHKTTDMETAGDELTSKAMATTPSVDVTKPICLFIIDTAAGFIESPGFPRGYQADSFCVWDVTVAPDKVIAFKFLHFDLAPKPINTNCSASYDNIQVVLNVATEFEQRVLYCGDVIPPQLTGLTNRLKLVFQGRHGVGAGFQAAYKAIYPRQRMLPIDFSNVLASAKSEDAYVASASTSQTLETTEFPTDKACNFAITESRGIIESLNFPNAMPPNMVCVWNISVAVGKVISLQFLYFHIDSYNINGECDEMYDNVEVILHGHDGKTKNSLRLCGTKIPRTIKTEGNRVDVILTSKYGIGTAFEAFYQEIDKEAPPVQKSLPGQADLATSKAVSDQQITTPRTPSPDRCSFTLTTPTGLIESPKFPRPYPQFTTCHWTIEVPEIRSIFFKFLVLDIDNGTDSDSCDDLYDHLKISTRDQSVILCGRDMPDDMEMTSNKVDLEFVSKSGFGAGFQLVYYALSTVVSLPAAREDTTSRANITHEYATSKRTESSTPTKESCGGFITSDHGIVTSPNFPDHYPEMMRCYWTILAPEGRIIVFTLLSVDIDSIPINGKCADVYDHLKIATGEENTHILCGSGIPQPLYSRTNTMTLEFVTKYGLGTGFLGIFTTLTLDETLFEVRKPSTIRPQTMTKPLELDFGTKARTLPVPTLPTPTTLTSQKTDCLSYLKGPIGIIESPNFPNYYPQDSQCTWNIEVDPENKIKLTFLHLDIDYHILNGACDKNYDHIEIKVNGTGGLLICGGDFQTQVTSDSNELRMTFVSRHGIGTGFQARYSEITAGGTPSERLLQTSGLRTQRKEHHHLTTTPQEIVAHSTEKAKLPCVFNITKTSGIIQSRNFPDPYPQNEHCIWNIKVPADKSIWLEIRVMDIDNLPMHGKCNKFYDHLAIISDGIPTKRLCGNRTPPPIHTLSNRLKLVFVTKYGYGYGFEAAYSTVDKIPYLEEMDGPVKSDRGDGKRNMSRIFFGEEIDTTGATEPPKENLDGKSDKSNFTRSIFENEDESFGEIDDVGSTMDGSGESDDATVASTNILDQSPAEPRFTATAPPTEGTNIMVTIREGEVELGSPKRLSEKQRNILIASVVGAIACAAFVFVLIGLTVFKCKGRRNIGSNSTSIDSENPSISNWVHEWPLQRPSV
ncbi:CUB and sushi domain-containing protein 1-like [Ptychodera flava]|uniref:CUB and sushi domain-containing protein 1-like n=1 Tax=Ptychodera flava TaxID=63121 RepID=UPI00396A493A